MSATRTIILLTVLVFRQVTKINCKNNLENHSFVNRLTTQLPTTTASHWSMLLNKNNSNTNAYSHGHTHYYSPSSYGQTSKPNSNNKFSYPSTSTSSPSYSQQVSGPVAYYGIGTTKAKVTFPDEDSKRSGSGTVYYKQNDKDSSDNDDRFKQEEYDYEEESYQPPKWSHSYREPYYAIRKRIQHKISPSKYEDPDDESTKKSDQETSRPSSTRDKPSYSESPWRYGGNRYGGGGHGYYEDRQHQAWQYPYDYEKMQAYHSSKEGYGGGPLAFLLGLLPLGLLMAAMVPNVVPVAAAAAAAGKRRRRALERPGLQYPVLEAIAKFGVTNLDDPKCLQRIFCTVTRDGRTTKSNIVQKAFYRVMSFVDENWVNNIGLKDLFRAVRRNQCENIVCSRLDKNLASQDGIVSKINATRTTKMKRRYAKFT